MPLDISLFDNQLSSKINNLAEQEYKNQMHKKKHSKQSYIQRIHNELFDLVKTLFANFEHHSKKGCTSLSLQVNIPFKKNYEKYEDIARDFFKNIFAIDSNETELARSKRAPKHNLVAQLEKIAELELKSQDSEDDGEYEICQWRVSWSENPALIPFPKKRPGLPLPIFAQELDVQDCLHESNRLKNVKTDISLVTQDAITHAHKHILAKRNSFFHEKLGNAQHENLQVDLKEYRSHIVMYALSTIYLKQPPKITLPFYDLIELARLSNHIGEKPLFAWCELQLSRMLTQDSFFHTMLYAGDTKETNLHPYLAWYYDQYKATLLSKELITFSFDELCVLYYVADMWKDKELIAKLSEECIYRAKQANLQKVALMVKKESSKADFLKSICSKIDQNRIRSIDEFQQEIMSKKFESLTMETSS